MFRAGARVALRSQNLSSLAPARTAARRYASTDPPHLKSRTFKNSLLRWGLAAGLVYYYNTSPVFAEYPQSNLLNPNIDALDDEKDHPTLDRLLESSRNKSQKDASVLQSALETSSQRSAGPMHMNAQAETLQGSTDTSSATSSAAEMEAEAEGEGAFNPVTGEINWDCPCLGGMAYGPCGEEFRTAFSCFVYSTAEPKGMDCVEKFGAMQECFRAHPEVYKGELEDDEALDGEMEGEKELLRKEIEERREQVAHKQKNLLDEPDRPGVSLATEAEAKAKQGSTQPLPQPHTTSTKTPQPEAKTTSHTPGEYSASKETEHGASSQTIRHVKTKGTDANATPESEELVPKAAHDARNTSVKDSHSSVRS